jgi:CBS domain-containing protein
MKQQTERFLEVYRRLEAVAPKVLSKEQQRGNGGIVARLVRHPKFAAYREELDCCREVRNLLTHEVQVDGQPAVIPSGAMISFLEKIIELIENPKRVKDCMTPLSHLLVVENDTPVLEIMEEMWRRGLSRVPLLEGGVVRGMLSLEAIFHVTMDGVRVTADTRVGEVRNYLALDGAPHTHYTFVSPETTVDTAEVIFREGQGRKNKLRALLVTEDGVPSGTLLGIVSPYDVLGQ